MPRPLSRGEGLGLTAYGGRRNPPRSASTRRVRQTGFERSVTSVRLRARWIAAMDLHGGLGPAEFARVRQPGIPRARRYVEMRARWPRPRSCNRVPALDLAVVARPVGQCHLGTVGVQPRAQVGAAAVEQVADAGFVSPARRGGEEVVQAMNQRGGPRPSVSYERHSPRESRRSRRGVAAGSTGVQAEVRIAPRSVGALAPSAARRTRTRATRPARDGASRCLICRPSSVGAA